MRLRVTVKVGYARDAGATGGLCPSPVSANACVDGCNPCTKVTDAQVATAVGLPAVQGTWNGDICEWDFTDAEGNPFTVSLGVNIDYRTFGDECHVENVPDSGITVTAVSGVGDDACYLVTGGSLQAYNLIPQGLRRLPGGRRWLAGAHPALLERHVADDREGHRGRHGREPLMRR
jgi:hypothetical protein